MSHSNTPPVRKLAPLTTRSSSLRCVSAAEHHTTEQYSKTGRTEPRKNLRKNDLSWNTRHDFLKIPVFETLFWKPSEDPSQRASRNQKSLRIWQGHQTPSEQLRMHCALCTMHCIVRDLEIVIVIVSLKINFIPQRSRIADSATVTLKPLDGAAAIKKEESST